MASSIADWNDKPVVVVTCDGRLIMGTLAGYDQLQNLILKGSEERVYSGTDSEVEVVPLGLYVIRGDNVAVIADTREEENDWEKQPARPINSVGQQNN
mmetsp:Transcript_444/g.432  ORF Transcript_444/g.432 Transcript_444/m.432 type:complete len:98 (+) Transcript_444:141-434(+)|eukprot:CAMPEP_0197832604 /NCGR_PEP_ID=MMETSP1437-20131217/15301_1 /TAXON_ID=49252 ORGANISM="Eucampia antarctica, Strain CCMP1452" /NCGR_SAMPLE_ID=MMETSP1437 /ASSEMBLY_ACC=CAM_ASM_001096 /LENGTH=97 /DNA_ID=CAMNT_0043436049 /DNA_START=141 /DNA_END=434 /DNA_ORIENTATION=+